MEREPKHLNPEAIAKIESAVRDIIEAVGDDPNREGVLKTPHRVAMMYDEVFEGMHYTNQEIADMFSVTFDEPEAKNMVVVKDIDAFSYCEHHLALMYDMKVAVAYIPDGKVIGLSKVPRIVDMVCKRLQLQERIASDIAEIMEMALGTHDVMVVVEGSHSCMSARGIKNVGSNTTSAVVRGLFKESPQVRTEALEYINRSEK